MLRITLFLVACAFAVSGNSQNIPDLPDLKKLKLKKKPQYHEVDFEEMMRRYFHKESSHTLEGIYSVSCVITKTKRVFLSKRERTRIIERKDNYARVAILKDWPGAKRDFIEVSLSYRDAKKYPIMGDFNMLSEGHGYIYNHIEPNGSIIAFSMLNESAELLEGEFAEMKRHTTIRYKLSYLKIYPKNTSLVVTDQ
ncbi:MAG TPA: hypothetical protein VEB86_02940 [Chryseosolibacter sp.]|nr:hypothetical protein [Chryseosolibacter sp.]